MIMAKSMLSSLRDAIGVTALRYAEKTFGRGALRERYSNETGWAKAKPALLRDIIFESTVIGDQWESGDTKWAKWRRLGSKRVVRGLDESTNKAIRDRSTQAYFGNLMASGMVDLKVAFMMAAGVTVKATHPDEAQRKAAQAVLDDWWTDETNDWDSLATQFPIWLSLLGEQIYPAFINPASGRVRLGYLDPEEIESVIRDPLNARALIAIKMRSRKVGGESGTAVPTEVDVEIAGEKEFDPRRILGDNPALLFRVINAPGRDELSPQGMAIVDALAEMFKGNPQQAFYFAINIAPNGVRGVGDLSQVIDTIDSMDAGIMDDLDRWRALGSFLWDVTLKGADERFVQEWVRIRFGGGSPKPGSVNAHTESEEWKAMAPELNAGDSTLLLRFVKNLVLGGFGLPEGWFGEGGETNRSTLGEQGPAALARIQERQRYLKKAYFKMARFALAQAIEHRPEDLRGLDPSLIQVEMHDVNSKNIKMQADILEKVTSSLAKAVTLGWLSTVSSRSIYLAQMKEMGFEVDEEQDAAALDEEQAASIPTSDVSTNGRTTIAQ